MRYITLSSKDLPYGVSEGISRAHFPLGNYGPDGNVEVLLTEGPLKADVASALYGAPTYFIAIQGVQNTRELPSVFEWLKQFGVKTISMAFDMDRLCNRNVRKATRNINRKIRDAGLSVSQKFWDAEYAAKKWEELHKICTELGVQYDRSSKSIHVQIAMMAEALDQIDAEHSIIHNTDGTETKNYWNDESKGIDDYLLTRKKALEAGGR